MMQYGRMRGKIEETMEEIGYLQEIRGSYRQYEEKQEETASCTYQISRLEILHLQSKIQELNDRMRDRKRKKPIWKKSRQNFRKNTKQ